MLKFQNKLNRRKIEDSSSSRRSSQIYYSTAPHCLWTRISGFGLSLSMPIVALHTSDAPIKQPDRIAEKWVPVSAIGRGILAGARPAEYKAFTEPAWT